MDEIKKRRTASGTALLVRPARKWDECVIGFHGRVAAQNGIRRRELEPLLPRQKVCTHAFGHPLPAWAWKYRGKEYFTSACIHCIWESRYIKQAWRIKFVEVCQVHHTLLRPARGLDNKRCSFDAIYSRLDDPTFRSDNTFRANYREEEWSVFQAIWPWLNAQRIVGSQALAASTLIATLLQRLAYVRAENGDTAQRQPFLVQVARWAKSIDLDICASRYGIDELLVRLPSSLHRAAAYRFLNEVVDAERIQRSVMRELPLQRWLSLLQSLLATGSDALAPYRQSAYERASLRQRTEELDVPSEKRQFLLDIFEGAVAQAIRERPKHGRIFKLHRAISLEMVAADICIPKEALHYLQLSVYPPMLQVLRRSGLLRNWQIGRHQFYLRSQMVGMLEKLTRHACPFEGQSALSLNDPTLYQGIADNAVAQLLSDICTGQVLVWHDLKCPGLWGIKVPHSIKTHLEAHTRQISSELSA
ncbi:hypothetical protein ABE501_01400 [Comamonas testosteroni]